MMIHLREGNDEQKGAIPTSATLTTMVANSSCSSTLTNGWCCCCWAWRSGRWSAGTYRSINSVKASVCSKSQRHVFKKKKTTHLQWGYHRMRYGLSIACPELIGRTRGRTKGVGVGASLEARLPGHGEGTTIRKGQAEVGWDDGLIWATSVVRTTMTVTGGDRWFC